MDDQPPAPISDSTCKRLYGFARLVEDLLRSLFGDAALDGGGRGDRALRDDLELLREVASGR